MAILPLSGGYTRHCLWEAFLLLFTVFVGGMPAFLYTFLATDMVIVILVNCYFNSKPLLIVSPLSEGTGGKGTG